MDILIVEDDQETLGGWVELIGGAGHRVTGAATYPDARRALAAAPDLLITDIRLGAYNGLQLVMHARSLNPRMPAIVVTGFRDAVLEGEAAKLGAMYLEKPVAADQLLTLIAEMSDHVSTPDR